MLKPNIIHESSKHRVRSRRAHHQQQGQQQHSHQKQSSDITSPHQWLNYSQSEALLALEGKDDIPVDCCPSVMEITEPEGGKNPDGMYVILYKDGNDRQRFYEMSCREDVLNRPCRFMDKRFHTRSRCIQKYSYSYAIVQEPSAASVYSTGSRDSSAAVRYLFQPARNSSWSLDYIKVRSGCSCEIDPKKKTRNRDKKKHNTR